MIDYWEIIELVESSPPLEPIGRITFIVRINNNKLKELDLKDELRVYTNDRTILMGYVDELFYSEFFAVFRCEGYKRAFRSTKLSVEFLPNLYEIPFKAFWFIARLFNEPENIRMDEKMIVQANFVDRNYIIIMPIKNLELNQPVQVLDVSFMNSMIPEEDSIIKLSNTYKFDKDWSAEIPKARVTIRADNFYEALMKGYKRILAIIDFICFRNDLSFAYYQDTKIMEFKNSLFFSRLEPTMKIFCKESESNHAMLYDLKPKDRTVWKSNDLPSDYFLPLKDFEKFYNSQTKLGEQQNTIILSIQWLALSIHSDNPIVKLINSWNSLEFALSGITFTPIFSNDDVKILEKHMDILLNKLNEDGEVNFSIKQMEAFKSKLNYLNDSPVMEKIRIFLNDHQIPFDENEMRLIKESRRKRNHIQHRKMNMKIKEEELEKLRSLTEKILLVRAMS